MKTRNKKNKDYLIIIGIAAVVILVIFLIYREYKNPEVYTGNCSDEILKLKSIQLSSNELEQAIYLLEFDNNLVIPIEKNKVGIELFINNDYVLNTCYTEQNRWYGINDV